MIKKTAFELKTIGSLLKEKRKERNLTIEQVAEITKIRSKYLSALEESRYEEFSSDVYLKGFLRNYARFLEISTDRALAMYRRENEYKQKEPIIKVAEKIKENGLNLEITTGKAIALVILSAVIITLIYVGTYIGNIFKTPEISISAPVEIAAGQQGIYKTTEDTVAITGRVDVGTNLTINGQQFETNNFEEFRKELNLNNGLNTFVFEAESQFGKKNSLTINILKESTTQTTTPSVSITPAPSSMLISIEIVNREAYLDVLIDGENLGGKVYTVGQKLEFEAQQTLGIFSPRPDTIKLTINGKQQTINAIQTYNWKLQNGKAVLVEEN